MRTLAAILLAAVLACTADGPPEAAYRAFVRAVGDRDGEKAWALLSSDTQAWLDAQAKEVARAAPGVIAPSGKGLLLGDAAQAGHPGLSRVVLLRESSGRAVVEVTEEGGAKREVELVREKTWRVRIPKP